jgi:hypothetical protein
MFSIGKWKRMGPGKKPGEEIFIRVLEYLSLAASPLPTPGNERLPASRSQNSKSESTKTSFFVLFCFVLFLFSVNFQSEKKKKNIL